MMLKKNELKFITALVMVVALGGTVACSKRASRKKPKDPAPVTATGVKVSKAAMDSVSNLEALRNQLNDLAEQSETLLVEIARSSANTGIAVESSKAHQLTVREIERAADKVDSLVVMMRQAAPKDEKEAKNFEASSVDTNLLMSLTEEVQVRMGMLASLLTPVKVDDSVISESVEVVKEESSEEVKAEDTVESKEEVKEEAKVEGLTEIDQELLEALRTQKLEKAGKTLLEALKELEEGSLKSVIVNVMDLAVADRKMPLARAKAQLGLMNVSLESDAKEVKSEEVKKDEGSSGLN